MQYFAPDYELDVRPSNMENANSPDYLEKIKLQVIENLKRTSAVPSVQATDVPRNPLIDGMDSDAEEAADDEDQDANPDVRYTHSANGIRRLREMMSYPKAKMKK